MIADGKKVIQIFLKMSRKSHIFTFLKYTSKPKHKEKK